MARVLITYAIPEPGPTLLRQAGHDVEMRTGEDIISREELLVAVTQYDAMLTLLTDTIDATVIAAAGPQLKIIANLAVGFDNVDVAAAKAKGIAVTNVADGLTTAVAEHTIALLGALARRIVESDQFVRAGKYQGWRPQLLLGTELTGKVLGIAGLGRIGSEVARRAQRGFGMRIVYTDLKPNPEFEREYEAAYFASIDDLLPAVDVLSLHVPLVPATRHLINAERLARMKKTALLLNTSRGPVVDEAALVAALQQGTIAGAALDVFEHEPELAPGLAALAQVVLTPHTASATIEARSTMSDIAAKNILAVLAGQPPLNPAR